MPLQHLRFRTIYLAFVLGVFLMGLAGCGTSLNIPLSIATQPASEVVQAGQPASFSVVAVAKGSLTYQWFVGGNPMSGATGSTYTIPATDVSENGTVLTVQVSDGQQAVTSAPASLSVLPLSASLGFVPVGTKIFGDPSFQVGAGSASSGAITYAVVSGPATVSEATVTLTGAGSVILSATQAANGNYAAATATTTFRVAAATPTLAFGPIGTKTFGDPGFQVSAGSASSGAITYAVVSGPATVSGMTVTLTGAGPVTLSATQAASGNYAAATATANIVVAAATPTLSFAAIGAKTFGDLTFQASAGSASDGLVTYSVASGPATVSGSAVTLTGFGTVVLSASQAATGSYTAATASTSFKVGVDIALSPITPAGITMGPGQQAFSAVVTGGPTDRLTWSASAGSISPAGLWTSPNTPGTYTITATSVEDPTKFLATTATVSLPVITGQPLSRSVCSAAPVTLSTAALYANSYQWYRDGSAISGATNASYTIPTASQTSSPGAYTVAVSNAAGSANSTAATLAVGSTLTANPDSVTVLAPATATFAVTAQGQMPFTYQWYSLLSGAAGPAAIPGATSNTYTIPNATLSSNGAQVYATVTDSCGQELTSQSATLTVDSPPVITVQPANQTIAPGSLATLSITVTGTPALFYQWYWLPAGLHKGIALSGANSSTYVVPASSTTPSNTGDQYFVTVSNTFGSIRSQPASLQTGASANSIWVVGWGANPENAQPGSGNSGGQEQSFRSFFYPTVSGSVERIHLSNYFGKTPIIVGAARLAAASDSNGPVGNAINPAQDVPLTFRGSAVVTLQPGQEVVSDPVQIPYTLGQQMAVSLYVQGIFPALTQHESQANTNYATPSGSGDKTTDAAGASFSNSNTEWFLLTGMDVYGPYQGTVALFGSSSVDGHASNFGDTNAYPVSNGPVPGQDHDRPSDWLGRQLTAAGYNIGVLNAGTIGDPAGEDSRSATGSVIAGVDRLQHDVLEQANVKTVIIYFGGIDLRGDCKPASDVQASLTNMVSQAYAAGVRVVLVTLPPSEYCTTVQPLPSAAAPYAGDITPGPENPGSIQRRALNDWIRTAGASLAGVVAIADFDAALADPRHPDFMLPTLNSGDNFHPNGVGYGVQSSAIPLSSLLGP